MEQENGWQKFQHHKWCFRGHSSVQCDHKEKVTTAFISQMFGQETLLRLAVQCAVHYTALQSSVLLANLYKLNLIYFFCKYFLQQQGFVCSAGKKNWHTAYTKSLDMCGQKHQFKNITNKSCHRGPAPLDYYPENYLHGDISS